MTATIDDIVMSLMKEVTVDKMTEAKKKGRLTLFFAKIAEKILGDISENDAPQLKHLDAVETISNPTTVRPPTPQPESVKSNKKFTDGVRVGRG